MKRLTLNDAWRFCLEQWDLIKEHEYENIEKIKKLYLKKHGFKDIISSCFFCEYAYQKNNHTYSYCSLCPAKLIDENFSCINTSDYGFREYPAKFHKKIIALNKKRRSI